MVIFERIETNAPSYADALCLRDEVLRKPLGLEWTNAELEDEKHCIHVVGIEETQVIATLLLRPIDAANVRMRQVAVHPNKQGLGIGAKLVSFAEELTGKLGYSGIRAHVRVPVAGFYRKLGYTISGDPFMEVTIPHLLATKQIALSRANSMGLASLP